MNLYRVTAKDGVTVHGVEYAYGDEVTLSPDKAASHSGGGLEFVASLNRAASAADAGPVAERREIARRAAELESSEAALEARAKELDERQGKLDETEAALEARAKELDERQGKLDETEAALEARAQELGEREEEVVKYEARLEERDKKLDEREAELEKAASTPKQAAPTKAAKG